MDSLKCGCSGEVRVVEGSRVEYDDSHFPIYIPHFSVHCRECVLMSKWYDTAEEAIAAWKLATRGDLVEELIMLLHIQTSPDPYKKGSMVEGLTTLLELRKIDVAKIHKRLNRETT